MTDIYMDPDDFAAVVDKARRLVAAAEKGIEVRQIDLARALVHADASGRRIADERDEWLGKCQLARAEIVRLGGSY